MTYLTVATIKDDAWIRARVAACAALEGLEGPAEWAFSHSWELASQPGWAEAWESASVRNQGVEKYEPGKDEGAVTDAMILAAVQALRTS